MQAREEATAAGATLACRERHGEEGVRRRGRERECQRRSRDVRQVVSRDETGSFIFLSRGGPTAAGNCPWASAMSYRRKRKNGERGLGEGHE